MGGTNFKVQLRKEYLFIRSSGMRKTFMDSVNASTELFQHIQGSNQRYILADYRDAGYELANSEYFNVTRFIEHKLPGYRNITLAIAVDAKFMEAARYWEGLLAERGFNINVFHTLSEAENWLLSKKSSEVVETSNGPAHLQS